MKCSISCSRPKHLQTMPVPTSRHSGGSLQTLCSSKAGIRLALNQRGAERPNLPRAAKLTGKLGPMASLKRIKNRTNTKNTIGKYKITSCHES